jgi:hypothetical protein
MDITTLAITLWFTILGIWFLWTLDVRLTENDEKSRKAMRLSIVRYSWEYLARQIIIRAEGSFMLQPDG